ncbi:MAG: cytochrome P450 [Kofleriaceae bacterium]
MARPAAASPAAGCPFAAPRPAASWWPRDLLAPFAGVPHHRPPGLEGLRFGHERAFQRATREEGLDASAYFLRSGIAACAQRGEGLCSFRLGAQVALYQLDNTPLVPDDALAPSLDANRELFGDFMGSQELAHPARKAKRLAVEATLGSARFVDALGPAVRRHAQDFLARASAGPALTLPDFTLAWVAYVDSLLPGVLDLAERPLTEYLSSATYGPVARAYFELASDVITNVNPQALRAASAIEPFIRAVLLDNFASLAAAPESNLLRRYFALWRQPFTRAAIDRLTASELKELGTILVATYDTTQLSLLWTICYVESDPALKRQVIEAARAGHEARGLSLLELVVLEAVRLGGSNPTALYRRLIRPVHVRHRGRAFVAPAGTMLWLDRRAANRDGAVFPAPRRFDPANVRAILRSERDGLASVLSRGRYEINSFCMVNTERNPRKCPGRLFSVRQQALLLAELYAAYEVRVEDVDLALRPNSAMPRPNRAGAIHLSARRALSTQGATQ